MTGPCPNCTHGTLTEGPATTHGYVVSTCDECGWTITQTVDELPNNRSPKGVVRNTFGQW